MKNLSTNAPNPNFLGQKFWVATTQALRVLSQYQLQYNEQTNKEHGPNSITKQSLSFVQYAVTVSVKWYQHNDITRF